MYGTLKERLWARINRNGINGCWLWEGFINADGYGQMRVGDKTMRVHRVIYGLFHGAIPDGLQIDHLCRIRHCANPKHLEAVTSQENTLRGNGPYLSRQRNLAKTHCPQGHPYNAENTLLKYLEYKFVL